MLTQERNLRKIPLSCTSFARPLTLPAKRKKQIIVKADLVHRGLPREAVTSFFVFKIFTSNPYALNILQTAFAKPAPVKPLRGWRGAGVPPQTPEIPKTDHVETPFLQPTIHFFFVTHPTGHL
jgi:hypothetical protein